MSCRFCCNSSSLLPVVWCDKRHEALNEAMKRVHVHSLVTIPHVRLHFALLVHTNTTIEVSGQQHANMSRYAIVRRACALGFGLWHEP